MYKLENVSFKYQESIFDEADICINEDKIGIIGENGIGKTTLLKLFNKELMPDTGSIEVDGRTYRVDFELEKYNKFTINDMISIAKQLKAFDCSKLEEYIELLNIRDYLDIEIGKLSKGTAKKVCLLLAFMTKDRVLLLDEPFESLDNKTNKALVEFFAKEERKIIIVSHELELLEESVEKIYEVKDKVLRVRKEASNE